MPFPVVVDHFGRGNPGQGPVNWRISLRCSIWSNPAVSM